jgi:cytoskeleton protein RodZ
MKSVGDIIKGGREARGLSLDEVARSTRIRAGFLSAIETNDFGQFESKTIARGFIKNYAEFLGVNSDSVLAIFKRDYVDKKDHPAGFACETGFCWTPKLTMIVVVTIFALLILGYLARQYLSLQTAPY